MAPNPDLSTIGTASFENKVYAPSSFTTQGKLAKAAAKSDNTKKIAPQNVPAMEKKPGKARSFVPPNEMAAAAKRRAEMKIASKGKSGKKETLLTTLAKIKAAEAKQKAKDPHGVAVREAKGKGKAIVQAAKAVGKAGAKGTATAAGRVQPKQAVKAKPLGMLSVLHSHSSSTIRFAKAEGGKHQAVMSRRTKKAGRLLKENREKAMARLEMQALWSDRDVQKVLKSCQGSLVKVLSLLRASDSLHKKFGTLVDAGLLPAPGILEITAADVQGASAQFRFLDLPRELRHEIYEFVVVEHKIFIRPDSVTGREQPDLAMVCRQVREEVLPVFYGKNTFAIDLTPSPRTAGTDGLKTAAAWARAIGNQSSAFPASSISFIRHWIFDYAAPVFINSDEADDDHALMLSVRFKKRTKLGSWSAVVEVHRDAACIMPAFAERGTCTVQIAPEWVNEAIIRVCDAAKQGGITGQLIMGLAMELRPRMQMLVKSRCKME
ncbi:hypothetical protein LTR53_006556 [Teratosphaeriaceae sp. CCFEE 6253]|nr:hypothetical protein LTR53_006556 [Teratosphaeriaceae sp. CCFEE 6253]